MDFLSFAAIVILAIALTKVNQKVTNLENAISSQKREAPVAPILEKDLNVSLPKEADSITSTSPIVENYPKPSGSNFGNWLKEDWIMKLGALLLLIGLGWFTTYAFMNNWIGPMGRIFLGIMLGIVFLIFGTWRIQKYPGQGDVFLALGSTTILLTIFAGRTYYNFFTPELALLAMFLSTVYVAFVGVKYSSKYLPLISLILAGVAPLLIGSAGQNAILLFSYLTIVILGVIWVVAVNGQRSLITASLLMVFIYSIPQFFSRGSDLLIFAYLFTFIFFVSNIISMLKSEAKNMIANLCTASLTALFLILWVLLKEQAEFRSLILVAWTIAFAISAFLVFIKTKRKEPFYIYALSSTVLLAAATALQLHGQALLIAYTIESAIISLSIYFVMRDVSTAELFSFLLIGPAFLSLGNISNYIFSSKLFNSDLFSLIFLATAILSIGLFFWRKAKEINDTFSTQLNDFWVILGSSYFYLIVWFFLQKLFKGMDVATTISLIIYTIIGLMVYFYGKWQEKKGFQIYGQVFLVLIVLRLLLVDISRMQISGKIITFFLIGILLISTAFLSRNKKLINNE